MNSTKQYNAVSRELIYKWHQRYSTGWEESGVKKGRPKELNKILQTVSDVIRGDRRLTVRETADIMGISKSSVKRILTLELKMSQVCVRWVPGRLTNDEMTRIWVLLYAKGLNAPFGKSTDNCQHAQSLQADMNRNFQLSLKFSSYQRGIQHFYTVSCLTK